jgi:hypothetical protein
MNFNNWEYKKDKQGLRVIPAFEKKHPNSFIKYYGLNNYSIDALTKGYLFFSHPLILNDPFDSCRQLVSLDKFSERQFVKLQERNQRFANPDINYTSNEIKEKISQWYKEDKAELEDSFLTLFWNLIFKDWGILSLAEVDNDMLMWSYYNNHQGFSIKLENEIFEDKNVFGAFPINYSEKYETISPGSIKLDPEQLLYVTNVKYSQWSHEKEWRFLVNKENMSIPNYTDSILSSDKRKVRYDIKKIKSIILGYKFFEDNITKTHFGKGKRLYQFYPENNEKDKLRLAVINYILENNVEAQEIEIAEDKTFSLIAKNISIVCKQKEREYFVLSEEYRKPSS